MSTLRFSNKGQALVKLYEQMVQEGYDTGDGQRIDNAFSDFELRAYRQQIWSTLKDHSIATVLDYGCGGSDWQTVGFDEISGRSAVDYFNLQSAYRYEPARGLDERRPVDCVISFDVLEHIFITDVPLVLRDMFSYAKKLMILNVACYPANAKLPNGENAHITVRPPHWWKGMIDSISIEYPTVSVCLICSTGWRKSGAFRVWAAEKWQEGNSFVTSM